MVLLSRYMKHRPKLFPFSENQHRLKLSQNKKVKVELGEVFVFRQKFGSMFQLWVYVPNFGSMFQLFWVYVPNPGSMFQSSCLCSKLRVLLRSSLHNKWEPVGWNYRSSSRSRNQRVHVCHCTPRHSLRHFLVCERRWLVCKVTSARSALQFVHAKGVWYATSLDFVVEGAVATLLS